MNRSSRWPTTHTTTHTVAISLCAGDVRGWSRKVLRKETAPLFACIGGAAFLAGWFMNRHFFNNPDVQWRKSERGNMFRDSPEQHAKADAWASGRRRTPALAQCARARAVVAAL